MKLTHQKVPFLELISRGEGILSFVDVSLILDKEFIENIEYYA